MSDKDKDKNVVEQLLDSVITSSDSNIVCLFNRKWAV